MLAGSNEAGSAPLGRPFLNFKYFKEQEQLHVLNIQNRKSTADIKKVVGLYEEFRAKNRVCTLLLMNQFNSLLVTGIR